MRLASHILSTVFHPLMMPTVIFALLLFHYPYLAISNNYFKSALLAMIFMMTCLLPALSIFLMYRFRIISDLNVRQRKERIYPLTLTLVIYFSATYFLYKEPAFDKIFSFTLLMVTGAIVILTIITQVWKISAHGIGIGGLTGFVLRMNFVFKDITYLQLFAALILISGLVLSARLALNAHTPKQVYAGFALGAFLSFMAYPWIVYIAEIYT